MVYHHTSCLLCGKILTTPTLLLECGFVTDARLEAKGSYLNRNCFFFPKWLNLGKTVEVILYHHFLATYAAKMLHLNLVFFFFFFSGVVT